MMRARLDVTLGIGALLVLQVLLGFGAVGLLSRMGPAISVILRENDASMAAAEEMLAELALPNGDRRSRQHFYAQLEFAERNITEPGEAIELATVRRVAARALAGEASARREAVAALRSLAAINRHGMARSGAAARQLGSAGAWAGALLAFTGVAMALIVMRRLYRRLLVPLGELHAALRARSDGDLLRRCRVVDAPLEFMELRDRINALLDCKPSDTPREERKRVHIDRAAVLALLDRLPTPAAVLGPEGALVAANERALEALAAGEAFRLAMSEAVSETLRTGGDTPLVIHREDLQAQRLEGDVGWLVFVRGAETASDATAAPSAAAGPATSALQELADAERDAPGAAPTAPAEPAAVAP